MSNLHERLAALSPAQLQGIRRGIEKESLRALPDGGLALTPHPGALGSALTHPHITTDFSESQIELVTGAHRGVEEALQELTEVHQFTYRALADAGDEMLWVSSMPCNMPTDETIPIARFGGSNIGRAKSVYRMGLGHRYGRRMQTISGIHYNWSLPGTGSDQYFGLIRNFRRHTFLLLALFGASPAVCGSFVAGRPHELQPLGENGTMHMPYGTSLRMGRLGYQSDAQSSLAVSYNGLDGYAASLQDALTRPYAAYEAFGVRNPGGDYNQLATSLLQIENEFYGSIRPKRVIRPGERPLHALRERGVEYVEVRCMDLDPFVPVGIAAQTVRFIDVFLLHCLLTDSPPDTPAEIAELGRNQHLTAARGREPGLRLSRGGAEVTLLAWGAQLLDECAPMAERLDRAHGDGRAYRDAVETAVRTLGDLGSAPSARVLAAVTDDFGKSFTRFGRDRSARIRDDLLGRTWSAAQQRRFEAMSQASVAEQQSIEAGDRVAFDEYLQRYLSPDRLGLMVAPTQVAEPALASSASA